MIIRPTGPVSGPDPIEPTVRTTRPTASSTPAIRDQVQISDTARLVAEALSVGSIRQARVEEIKRLIESGQYETDDRLAKAILAFIQKHPDSSI